MLVKVRDAGSGDSGEHELGAERIAQRGREATSESSQLGPFFVAQIADVRGVAIAIDPQVAETRQAVLVLRPMPDPEPLGPTDQFARQRSPSRCLRQIAHSAT